MLNYFQQHLNVRSILEFFVSVIVFWIVYMIFRRRWLKPDLHVLLHKKVLWTDTGYWFFNRWVTTPLFMSVFIPLNAYIMKALDWNGRIFDDLSQVSFFPQLLLGLLVWDFFAYWRHRWTHSHWLWPIHAPHHSSTELNWLSGIREHFLDVIVITLFGSIIMFWLGFSIQVIITASMIRYYWVSFLHTDIDLDLGPLNYIFVTPRFHHWHHIKKWNGGQNYSGFFSFYDLMFGTFYFPKNERAQDFGLEEPYPESFKEHLLQPFRDYALRLKK